MDRVSITIVGGGVIGCAVAHELSKTGARDILLIERNPKIKGDNQSSRNSGIIHAGIYYSRATEPLKAKLCVEGNRLLYEFCEEFGVPHRRTGKLVVAVDALEAEYLDEVRADAADNGVPGFRMLDGREVGELEPSVRASKALYFPTTGLVEPTELVGALHHQAEARGVFFLPGNRVVQISPQKDSFEVVTQGRDGTETFATGLLINAAGLYSDEVARLVNPDSPYRILPIRGEWARFTKGRRPEISMGEMSVYPAPYGADNTTGERVRAPYAEYRRLLQQGRVTKSIGIHLSPTFDLVEDEYVVGNTVIVGPTYVVGVEKEDYSAKHREPYYLDKVNAFFPGLRTEDLELHSTGIRAKLQGRSDFVIEREARHPKCISLVGIDSPGLTASLAIARYVKDMIRD
jgi:L-2-hydroxyglutarate oxidase LhgO